MFYLKKNEKHLEISVFYTCVPKTWWYDLRFLKHRLCWLKPVVMGHLLPFTPSPKNQNKSEFEKMKKSAVKIIILHMCTKDHNHMRQTEFIVILGHFLPFYLTPAPL